MIDFIKSQDFYHILWFFILYSFLGWIWESCYCSVRAKKLINRGFLNGPVIPLYGCGALSIYLVLYPYQGNWAAVYMGGVLLASLLEYVTSWLMERLFDATLWDYSDTKFNINGRICLKASLLWGFFACILVEWLHPAALYIINTITYTAGVIVGAVFCILFSADLIYTVIGALDIKKSLAKMENIRMEIQDYLVSSKLAEQLEDIKVPDVLGYVKEQWDERKKFLDHIPAAGTIGEYKDEMINRLSELTKRYESMTKHYEWMIKRQIKAYPHFNSRRHGRSLQDLKDYLMNRKKGK